jgi:hypothetical protein
MKLARTANVRSRLHRAASLHLSSNIVSYDNSRYFRFTAPVQETFLFSRGSFPLRIFVLLARVAFIDPSRPFKRMSRATELEKVLQEGNSPYSAGRGYKHELRTCILRQCLGQTQFAVRPGLRCLGGELRRAQGHCGISMRILGRQWPFSSV